MIALYIALALILFSLVFYSYTENIIPMILVICVFGIYTLVYTVDCHQCKKFVESFMNYFTDPDEQLAYETAQNQLREEMMKALDEINAQLGPAQKRLNELRLLSAIDEEENDEMLSLQSLIDSLRKKYANQIIEFQNEIDELNLIGKYDTDNNKSSESVTDVQDLTDQTDDEPFIRACNVKPSKVIYNKNPDPSVWIRKDSIPCWGCNP